MSNEETEKPKLIRRSLATLKNDFGQLFEYAKPLLLYYVPVSFLIAYMLEEAQGMLWAKGVLITLLALFGGYLMICYAFSVHRHVLKGESPENTVNPFALKQDEKKFIFAWIKISIISILASFVVIGIGGGLTYLLASISNILGVIGVLLLFVLFIYVMAVVTRLMFVLPAQATGEPISFKDASALFKGHVLKFWWSIFVFAILVMLVLTPVLIIMGFAFAILFGAFEGSIIYFIARFFMLDIISSIAANFFGAAFGAILLSKLYLWALDKNKEVAV